MFDKFFKDKDGKVVIGQTPNVWIIGWFFTFFASLADTSLSDELFFVSRIFLVIFASLELYSGVNLFRKTLGAAILLFIVLSLFV